MQDLDPQIRTLVYAFIVGIPLMVCLAVVRLAQLMILFSKANVSLSTPKPDFPEYRRWQRTNGVLFGSIVLIVGLAVACYTFSLAWAAFRGDENDDATLLATSAAVEAIIAIAFGAYPIWYSLRKSR